VIFIDKRKDGVVDMRQVSGVEAATEDGSWALGGLSGMPSTTSQAADGRYVPQLFLDF
jgi:hypothetical protein